MVLRLVASKLKKAYVEVTASISLQTRLFTICTDLLEKKEDRVSRLPATSKSEAPTSITDQQNPIPVQFKATSSCYHQKYESKLVILGYRYNPDQTTNSAEAGGSGAAVARTLDELLEVGSAERGDGDGVLRPERGLLVSVSVGVPLQIPQGRGEHERRGHLARRAAEGEGRRASGLGWGTGGEEWRVFRNRERETVSFREGVSLYGEKGPRLMWGGGHQPLNRTISGIHLFLKKIF